MTAFGFEKEFSGIDIIESKILSRWGIGRAKYPIEWLRLAEIEQTTFLGRFEYNRSTYVLYGSEYLPEPPTTEQMAAYGETNLKLQQTPEGETIVRSKSRSYMPFLDDCYVLFRR